MIKYKGGNGLTIILGAKDEMEGVDAEYHWLEEKFGKQNINWELNDQQFIDEGDKQFDVLRIKFRVGKSDEFWFDITDIYGK